MFGECLESEPGREALRGAIGNPEGEEPSDRLIDRARLALASVLQVAVPQQGRALWAEALAKVVALAGDPDVSVPEWLGRSTPLGIARPIPAHGIFPTL